MLEWLKPRKLKPVQTLFAFQAEAVLITLANLIQVSDYSTDGMNQKTNYLQVSVSSGQKMCAGIVMGQPAAIAKTSLSVLSSVKNNFATVDTDYIDAACSDCPNNVKTPAKVLLGTALKGSFGSWTCDTDTTCNGACVVTTQVTKSHLVARHILHLMVLLAKDLVTKFKILKLFGSGLFLIFVSLVETFKQSINSLSYSKLGNKFWFSWC